MRFRPSKLFRDFFARLRGTPAKRRRRWRQYRQRGVEVLAPPPARRAVAAEYPPPGAWNRRRWAKGVQRAMRARRPRVERRATRRTDRIERQIERQRARLTELLGNV